VRTINYEAFYEGPDSSRASSSQKDVSNSPSIYSQGGS
jgi:hypothetical protein